MFVNADFSLPVIVEPGQYQCGPPRRNRASSG
jgi:hypothetical protein